MLRPLLGFTTDKQQATTVLEALNYGLGMAQLNFYDSLAAAVNWLASGNSKKTIVLLTTGLDSSGPGHWEHMLAQLRQSNAMVLPVALGGELRDTDKRGKNSNPEAANAGNGISFAASTQALSVIAAETGGTVFFPRTRRDFETAFRRIAALVRHQYNLGFAAGARDAGYHTIRVEVVDESGRPFDGKNGKRAYHLNSWRGFLAAQP